MYDEASLVLPRKMRALDDYDNMRERRDGRAQAGGEIPPRQVLRVAPLNASRLAVLCDDALRASMVVLMRPAGGVSFVSYISHDMHGYGGRVWFETADASVITLADLGVRLELSGRVGGGIYFRALAARPRIVTTPSGRRVQWKPRPNWCRLHRNHEQELVN